MKSGRTLLLLAAAAPLAAQYAGPAILSRGEAPAAMAAPQVDFRPYIEVGGLYDNGLAGVAVNDQGQLASASSYGVSLAWGLSGSHSWRHTKLGLDYRGALSYYGQQSGYSSLDQTLLLGASHQISRHVFIDLRQTAGIINRDFGQVGLRQTVPFDPSSSFVPVTDYFDNRTVYTTTQADLRYQRTARLSFVFGGDGSLVRRRSKALYGTDGVSARADVQYRFSRQVTMGGQYVYMHLSYPGLPGGTDVHGGALTFAVRINRELEFSGYGGFMRVESKFIQAVPVDPVIAALLGITSAPQVAHSINYTPNLAGRLSRTYRSGVLYASGGHSVSPGNGLFLTSIITTVSGGYSYTGIRRWSFGASVGHTRARATGTIVGQYDDTFGSLLMSRQIAHNFHFIVSYSARQYSSPDFANYHRTINEGKVSVGWSPGDIPLRIW